jgi:hypothetical protein
MNGKVRVSDGETARLVNAHERATSAAARVDVNAVSRSEEAASWALLGPTMLWHDPVSGVLELNGEGGKVEASLDGQSLGQAPLMSLVPVGSHRLVVRDDTGVLLDETLHWNAGESRKVRYRQPDSIPAIVLPAPREAKPRRRAATPVVAKTSEPMAAVAKTSDEVPASDELAMPSAAELLRSARKLMREGRMRPAAEAYEALRRTYPHSEEAHTVLVSLGQLQLAGLHDPGRALALLDAYLARGGTLSEEARITRVHALRELGRQSDEAEAIREFLSKHPRSFEAASLRDRLAALRAAE